MCETIATGKHPFVMCNFAPPDMVGHSGVYEATVKACEATGLCVYSFYNCLTYAFLRNFQTRQ